MTIKYQSPNEPAVENPNIDELRTKMIDNFPEYWHQGKGTAAIQYICEEKGHRSLLIFPDDKYGIYLKYSTKENGRVKETWLSMENHLWMDTHIECSDEWYASVGLYMPVEKAWAGIKYFLETGERFPKIEWRNTKDMPEGSNW